MSEIKYNINIDLSQYPLDEVEKFIDKMRVKKKIDELEKLKQQIIAQNPELNVTNFSKKIGLNYLIKSNRN